MSLLTMKNIRVSDPDERGKINQIQRSEVMPKIEETPVTQTTTTPAAENTAAPRKERKKAEKKAAKSQPAKAEKKNPKKPAPKKTSAKAEKNGKVDRSMADVPPGERKSALVKALRKLGAVKASSVAKAQDLCKATGYTPFDVYGLVNGTSGKAGSSPTCLSATGHVKVADHEDGRGYYLTAKGIKTGFDEVPFVRAKSK